LKDLEAALMELPKATGKNVIRRALIAAATPIAGEAQTLIKVKRQRPAVVISKVKFSAGDAGKRAFAEALARGASREEAGEAAHEANAAANGEGNNITSGYVAVGPTPRAFYGFEWGTTYVAPAPFMRPAWHLHKADALEIIQTQLRDEIDKAQKRIAAKNARLIAKTKAA
jgi:hypothetical protein